MRRRTLKPQLKTPFVTWALASTLRSSWPWDAQTRNRAAGRIVPGKSRSGQENATPWTTASSSHSFLNFFQQRMQRRGDFIWALRQYVTGRRTRQTLKWPSTIHK
jgi:hypothetical protein